MNLNLKDIYFISESALSKKKLKKLYFKEAPESGNIDIDKKTLMQSTALEKEIEQDINQSVSLEESNNKLEEKMSAGGFEYESVVIDALRQAKASGNIKSGAGANAAAADADMNVFGKIFDVEIKLNRNAQMGGSSVRYNKGGVISLVNPMEDSTRQILSQAIMQKSSEIEDLLDFLVSQEPREFNGKAAKFPITVTKETWIKAQESGKLVNTKFPLSAEFISKHYAKKGIYYIQIGGSGLFFLAKNPANLPIPKLKGSINIEVRSARSGSRKLSNGLRVVGAGIRVQGRLKTKNVSPFTLDDPASIQKMFAEMKKKNATPSVAKPADAGKTTSAAGSKPARAGKKVSGNKKQSFPKKMGF